MKINLRHEVAMWALGLLWTGLALFRASWVWPQTWMPCLLSWLSCCCC